MMRDIIPIFDDKQKKRPAKQRTFFLPRSATCCSAKRCQPIKSPHFFSSQSYSCTALGSNFQSKHVAKAIQLTQTAADVLVGQKQ